MYTCNYTAAVLGWRARSGSNGTRARRNPTCASMASTSKPLHACSTTLMSTNMKKGSSMEKPASGPSAKSLESSSSSVTRHTRKAKKKSSASSPRGPRHQGNLVRIKGIPKMTDEMRRQLDALEALPEDQIDFSDIPEMTEEDWLKPHYIGLHYRPGKKSVTIRLDEDLVRWFKKQGKGW